MLQNHGRLPKAYVRCYKFFKVSVSGEFYESTGLKNKFNKELHERTCMQHVSLEVKRRRWRWIGQVCRMPLTSIPRVALRWTPYGKRARGRPKQTWRRSVELEMKTLGWRWGQVTKLAADRKHRRPLVVALCVIPHEED